MRRLFVLPALGAAIFGLMALAPADAQIRANGSRSARSLITRPIDPTQMITLRGNVRADLKPEHDLGLAARVEANPVNPDRPRKGSLRPHLELG